MRPNDDDLTLEALDEQLDWHAQVSPTLLPGSRLSSTTQLIQGLHHLYENEQADAQSVEEVRRRLIERGALPASSRPYSRPPRARHSQPDSGLPLPRADESARRRWSLAQRVTAIAAAVVLVALVGGLLAGLVLVRQHPTVVSNQGTATPGQSPVASPTQPPAPPQAITYIGSDGNIWEMTWPGGTPQQWTNQARAGEVGYSGLAWSPDGKMLAVLRTDNANTLNPAYTLLILSADGTVLHRVSLPVADGRANEIPFAWSPDSKMLAYRGDITVEPTLNGVRKLLLFDAQTGQLKKTLTYEVGGATGCGGGGPVSPLTGEIWLVEHEGFEMPTDAFAWSPDGRSLLFTRRILGSCGQGQGIRIDVGTGMTHAPYPFVGSYQPGGNLILGYWQDAGARQDGTLGLADLSGKHVRALVKPEPPANPPQYIVSLGLAVWSSDGKSVYYEHDDSIWQIGVDGSNPHQVVAGTALDSQDNATVQLVPHPSPDGQRLLYLQATGSNRAVDTGDPTPQPTPTIPLTTRWYVAQADGSNPVALPAGVKEAVWQPGK